MMFSKNLLTLIFAIFAVILIRNLEAYRLDDDQGRMSQLDENNELNDPYLIQRLQALLAIVSNADNDQMMNKDSSAFDHRLNTRFAANRRPGLLRLKKSV